MTRSDQKLNRAIEKLKEEYIKSQASCSVNKPMAHALYQVFKYYDKKERGRLEASEKHNFKC